jgi:hypothetical protein
MLILLVLAQFVLLQHAIKTIPSLSEITKRWEHDVAWCRREGGACGNRVRRRRACDHEGNGWIMVMWEREELSPRSKGGKKHVHIDKPLALVLTPAACQALIWAAGSLLGRSSKVLE